MQWAPQWQHNLMGLYLRATIFSSPLVKTLCFLGHVSIFQQTFPPESSINSLQNRKFPSFLCLWEMGALGNGGFWWKFPPRGHRFRSRRSRSSSSSNGSDHPINGGGSSFNFPLKSATTAASLALAGDTIAQIRDRYKLLDRSDSKNKVVGCVSCVSCLFSVFGFFFFYWDLDGFCFIFHVLFSNVCIGILWVIISAKPNEEEGKTCEYLLGLCLVLAKGQALGWPDWSIRLARDQALG